MNPYSDQIEENGKYPHFSWHAIIRVAYIITIPFVILFISLLLFLSIQGKGFNIVLSFILIAACLWMLKSVATYFRRFAQKHSYHYTYVLDNDTLTYTIVNDSDKETQSDVIPHASIRHVVASSYNLSHSHLSTNAVTSKKHSKTDFPILYVVYTDGPTTKQVTIPFYKRPTVEYWLWRFQAYKVPLYYGLVDTPTAVMDAAEYNPESVQAAFIDELLKTDNMAPIQMESGSNWDQISTDLRRDVYKEQLATQTTEANQHDDTLLKQYPKSIKPLKKLTFNKWYKTAIVTALMLLSAMMVTIYLAEKEIFDYTNLLPGFVILLITATVYFWLMRHYYKWFYMIFFCIESFCIFLMSTLSIAKENTTQLTEEITTNLLASSILFPFIIWVPYLLVSYLRKRAGSENEKAQA